LSIQAATDESTPPDIPTTTLEGFEAGIATELKGIIKKCENSLSAKKPIVEVLLQIYEICGKT
jgi:hypothetical protein